MKGEIWKNTEYDGYMVSDKGKVKNKQSNYIKKEQDNGHGYKTVQLFNKHVYIHRLVATAFIPNPNNYTQINHKNGNKADNRVENLEWCSARYNQKHRYVVLKQKYKGKHILCVETQDVFENTLKIEKITGLSSAAIRRVLCGQAKTSAGYHWKYTDKEITNIDCHKYKKHTTKANIARKIGLAPATFGWRLKNGWNYKEITELKSNLANRYIRKKLKKQKFECINIP